MRLVSSTRLGPEERMQKSVYLLFECLCVFVCSVCVFAVQMQPQIGARGVFSQTPYRQ